jgi:hypothetical protein
VDVERVAIVLTPRSGELLRLLVRDHEVWAFKCREHLEVARASRGRLNLIPREARSDEDLLMCVLHSIEVPWCALDVVGAAPTYPVVRRLQDYAVARVEASATGFSAYRS